MRIPLGCAALAFGLSGCGACDIDLSIDDPGDDDFFRSFQTRDGGVGRTAPLFVGAPARATPSPKPISGGTLAFDGRTDLVAVGDPDRDVVYIVDYERFALEHTVELRFGDDPGRAVFDHDGRVHVVARGGGTLVTIDPTQGVITERRAVCPAPRGLDFDGSKLYVACVGGELHELPTVGTATATPIFIAKDLRDVVVRGETIWLSSLRHAKVFERRSDGQVRTHRIPSVQRNQRNFEPAVAWRMVGWGEGVAVLHQYASTSALVVSPTRGYYESSAPTTASSCSSPVILSAISAVTSNGVAGVTGFLPNAVLPVDLAYRPVSDSFLIAQPGSVPETVFEMSTRFEEPTGTDPGCARAARDAPADLDVISVGVTRRDVRVYFSRDPAVLSVGGRKIDLLGRDVAHTGHEMFHRDLGSGVACASCHPEGRDDGHVWNFVPAGPRRTQSSRGIAGTEPFHWDGDLEDLRHLVDEVMTVRMGAGEVQPWQLDLLTEWIEGLSPLAVGPPKDAAAIARGREVFLRSGCGSCHAGTRLTNNTTADVGTGGRFQVPSLLGLASRAPYMHNGCAETIRDRFGPCGGGRPHGATDLLSEVELDDLIVYLESL